MIFKINSTTAHEPKLLLAAFALLLSFCGSQIASAQTWKKGKGGVIRSVSDSEIRVRSSGSGKTQSFYINTKENSRSNLPKTKIKVAGMIPVKFLSPGMVVQFSVPVNSKGRSEDRVESLKVIESSDAELKIVPEREPEGRDYVPAVITATVSQFAKGRLRLTLPKSDYARSGKISVLLTQDAKVEITAGSFGMVMAGDTVKSTKFASLTDGSSFASELEIELTADRSKELSFDELLERKFSSLSDEPGDPRELRSDHFVLYTDVSDRSAAILTAKLERMYGLIGGYFSKRPRQPIECYVVRPENLEAWGERIPPNGQKKIAEPAGVTQSQTMGRNTVATVYSCDDHGVVQHEAVHAYCAMSFGSTGPVWYSEGMAEMGQYWREGQLEVNIPQSVINYLTKAEPKKMKDIVAAGQVTGDSWQAYAWRWALCHLLANNPNYASRFKRLGMTLMVKGPDSFDNAFGPVAPQISFEYDQFVENFGNGYRVDLCVWDWRSKPKKLGSSSKARLKVKAQAGWQSTRVETVAGTNYSFTANGEWNFDAENKTDADGNERGEGRLVGVLYKNFALSKPFDLGTSGTFVAPSGGHLYVRCNDDWKDLGNNDGLVELEIRKAAAEE